MNTTDEGAPGYGGYEYQIMVTVWVALDLMLRRECCDAIEVEPASQEDIEADLRVPPEEAETVVSVASGDGPIEIQIKQRSRYWSKAEFLELVETPMRGSRGPAPRERALVRLRANPRLRYVLITDAEVHPTLKDFVLEELGGMSRATPRLEMSADVAARIGVREKRVPELVEHEINDILEQAAHVPFQQVPACRTALVERVRRRLLGRCAPTLARSELEGLIAQNGGFPLGGDDFVPPARFDELRQRLNEPPFALLLVGSPGIGKTRAAEQLVDEHRRADRPFELAKDPSPYEIRTALARPGRTLFYLEDPWGRYKLAEDAAIWSDELPRLIREAAGNPDKRFLITSRTALLNDSSLQGRDPERLQHKLGAWVVQLVEGDFDVPARRRILRLGMRGAERWQRDWVEDRLADVVANLNVPHALSTFAYALKSARQADGLRLQQLLAESQVAAIGDIVKQQVLELKELAAGITLWAYLAVGEPLTVAVVEKLALPLNERVDADLPRLIKQLIANGWLTARDDVLTAHPTVIEGLESLVNENGMSAKRTLQVLFAVLVEHGSVAVASRILYRLFDRNLPVPAAARAAIEHHLRDAVLTCEDLQFSPALASFARISTASDPVALLARALDARSRPHGFDDWSPPAWTEVQRSDVSSSPDAEKLARRYIRTALPWHSSLGEEKLVDFLWSFGWDLFDDFTSTAIEALERGENADVVLSGALAAPAPAWDRLLDAAVDEYVAVKRWFDEEGSIEQRRAEEGELDAAHSAHIIDEPSERFGPASSALEKIVATRRAHQGYNWLVNHPRLAMLVHPWAESIQYDSGEAVQQELGVLLDAAESSSRFAVWKAIGRSRCLSFTPRLLTSLAAGPVVELPSIWGALFGMYEPEELAQTVGPTLAAAGWDRRAVIAFATQSARMPDRHDYFYREVSDHQRCVRDLLSPKERRALDACSDALATTKDPASGLEADVIDLLTAVAYGPNELLGAGACLVLACQGRFSQSATQRLLSSDDKLVRLHTLRAIAKTQPLDRAALTRALADGYYKCRRYAMSELMGDASTTERALIMERACDASAPVREACARIIGLQRWSDGVATLCALLADKRNRDAGDFVNDATPDYHVARAAARALHRLSPPLSPSHYAPLLRFLRGGRGACADVVVHYELLAVVGRQRNGALPRLIQHFLSSPWRMGGENGTFPLRYAAAWSWVNHILDFCDDASLLPPNALVEAAEHTDDRLAAPALLALGIAWKAMPDNVQGVLANSELADERCLLTEVGARVAGEPLPESMIAPRLPPSHPGRQLIDWCWEAVESDDAWSARLSTATEVHLWIETIRASSPVNSTLRAGLLKSPRKHLLTMISGDNFRKDELKPGTPVISPFRFASLE